ncbi:hypothetical protein CMQ_3550 [Grosmannia clavigera kw1407]|uniref:DUF7143 domain-containing protein n=1 Tax=Grosmannia clavigera (strain kw1407 / UAMH 11150) TaxID=655863 RepID=F0X8M7_GROCL|nr:uncharacterized protein CMQ_3550 [Grosmannia clavigera kw1407]EFX05481.1 hypothetical protein CMQ_3550 [Grosmannia clavigera kw1407]
MRVSFVALACATGALAAPLIQRCNLCTIVGSTTLPAETLDAANALANTVTCSTTTTIGTVPDAISGDVKFSSINFADSKNSTLGFALSTFATATPLASTDLAHFQNMLNVYVATEAGVRSVGGSLAVKVPKFFLEFQVSRIQTAQGNAPTDASLTVPHLLTKVLKNAAGQSQAFLDEVTALSKQLS